MGFFKVKKPADEAGASEATLGKLESRFQRSRWTKMLEGKTDILKTTMDHRNVPKDQEAKSLWDRAYSALKERDPRLVTEYENLLSMELSCTKSNSSPSDIDQNAHGGRVSNEVVDQIDNANPQKRRAQLDRIIEAGLQRIDGKKKKYRIAGREFVLQDQFAQASDLLLEMKDFVGVALQASPPAALAWAGVCMILPLLTRPSTTEKANSDGFTYVTARLRYYVALEPLLLSKNQVLADGNPHPLRREFEDNIINLYQHILDFQFKSILRFYRDEFKQYVLDMVSYENWKDMRSKINDLETLVRQDSEQINTLSSRQELESLNKNAKESVQTMSQILAVNERQLQVTENHRDISAAQLQVQHVIAKKLFSRDEEQCHQSFRLTKGNTDDSYEWYKGRVENRVEGTCQWFLDHEKFHDWLKQDSGPLLVSADPGCGKSVLAKYLIDHGLPRSATICYFFFKEQDQNTIKQALCALLHQLFSQKPSLIRHAIPEYVKNGAHLANITTSLWSILESAGQDPETGSVIFVLDALDECIESDFKAFISMMKRQFLRTTTIQSKVRFLLTSRPYDSIVTEFQELVDSIPYVRIPGEEQSETISQEVNSVIIHRVDQLAKEKHLPIKVEIYLREKLLRIPHRTYLWVYLVFESLKAEGFKKTEKGVEDSIKTIPDSVNQAYEKILSKSKKDTMVRKALCIVLAANRPLTLAEMNIAVSMDMSARSVEDLDLEDEDDFIERLRSWCGLFISIYRNKIYFLHQTAREFLLSELSPPKMVPEQQLSWYHSITPRQAHSVLAEICVTYLNFLNSENVALSNGDKSTEKYIFLDYSAVNWSTHLREAHVSSDSEILPLVLMICEPGKKSFPVWANVYFTEVDVDFHHDSPIIMTASYFGLETVVQLLLNTDKVDIDLKDDWYGQTPLSLAAENGHEAVVQLLLDTGRVDIDSKDNWYGQTPLSLAAENGHEAVAQLLVDTGVVDVDSKDCDGRTPFSWAAENGHEAIIQLLLNTGRVDVDLQDTRHGQSPLSWAAENGHDGVVELLLNTGRVDVNSKDYSGRTPLSWAAENGQDTVAQLLLSTGRVDVNSKNDIGQTPLSLAAKFGHKAIVQLLLNTDGVELNSKDDGGRTPLSWAAGHAAVFQLLLDTGKVNIDAGFINTTKVDNDSEDDNG